MNPVVAYIEAAGISQKELSEKAGLSPQYVNGYVKGQRAIGRKGALKLQEATAGAISAHAVISWTPDGGWPDLGKKRARRGSKRKRARAKTATGRKAGPAPAAGASR